MRIDLSGDSRVSAKLGGFTVDTDQPVRAGGDGSAPAPFDYFLASIGTCAGFYVQEFLHHRGLPTEGVHLTLTTTRRPGSKMLARITLRLVLPEGFPDRYRMAIARAVDLCTVKRHILDPPLFETIVETSPGRDDPAPVPISATAESVH